MRIGNVKGILIILNGWFLLLLAVFSFLGLLNEVLLAFFFVALHEVAHVAAACCFQMRVQKIELYPFGGVAQMDGFLDASVWQQILVALAGPVFSLILSGLFIAGQHLGYPFNDVYISINFMLGALNLFPAFPLDGGRIFRALIRVVCTEERSVRIVSMSSISIGIGFMLWSLYEYVNLQSVNLSLIMIGILVFAAALKEIRFVRYRMVKKMLLKRSALKKAGQLPLSFCVALQDVLAVRLIKNFSSSQYHVVLVLDERQQILGMVTEAQLVETLERLRGDATLGEMISFGGVTFKANVPEERGR